MKLDFFNFFYQDIYPHQRNFEMVGKPVLFERRADLIALKMWNKFLCDYIDIDMDIKTLHDKWDEKRKSKIKGLVYNGQILNRPLIKKGYVTIEYLKLLSWAYSPLPPHILMKEKP